MFCDECGARLVNGKCMACSIDYNSGSPVRMSRPAPAPTHYDPGPAPAPAPAPQPDYSAIKKTMIRPTYLSPLTRRSLPRWATPMRRASSAPE